MFNDLITSAKETLLDRLTSPLIGSFILAWPLWNYKFLVILLSSNSVTTTFRLIETVAFRSDWEVVWRGVLAPLASALAYVFLYPFPATLVFRYVRTHQATLNRIKQEIEGAELLSVEQSRAIRSAARAEVQQAQRLVDEMSSENRALKESVENLEGRLRSLEKRPPLSSFETALGGTDIDALMGIVSTLEKRKASILSAADLASTMGSSRTAAEHAMDRLIEIKALSRRGANHYELTALGRSLAMRKFVSDELETLPPEKQ
ncbi:hypothetical protein [Mitsuaria sp. GD03876]|uniref:hypothetical protein n=1 Tax=Mitsuaria sp. GD03876 TaxID=2975399 RepID=UPI00244AFFDA|nr:hypothetical protein [Mitsuaria sp. GD03876]MDH0866615.1 hypothetical protein [Mitsuaria sp. GD03876]